MMQMALGPQLTHDALKATPSSCAAVSSPVQHLEVQAVAAACVSSPCPSSCTVSTTATEPPAAYASSRSSSAGSSSSSSTSSSCCTSALASPAGVTAEDAAATSLAADGSSAGAMAAAPLLCGGCARPEQQQLVVAMQAVQAPMGEACLPVPVLAPPSAAAATGEVLQHSSCGSSLEPNGMPEPTLLQLARTTAPAAAAADSETGEEGSMDQGPPGSSSGQPGSCSEAQQQPGILAELGVSYDSLMRLLTGDCAVQSQQPVWMVVNLQGKIKGSYTACKMVEFSRRGTLSSAQLVLGIDKDLPYVSRQDLGFYRRIDEVLQAVHAGAVYAPLTQQTVEHLAQSGQVPAKWQPLVKAPPAESASQAAAAEAAGHDGGAAAADGNASSTSNGSGAATRSSSGRSNSSSTSSGSSSSAHQAAAAADARLQLALQRLCGCSSESMAAAAAAAAEGSPCCAAAPAAAGAGGADSPALSRASSSSCQAFSALAGQDSASAAAAAAAVPAAAAQTGGVGEDSSCDGASGGGDGSGSKEPVWLYINHLGWCRGPFPGEKMVQAHLCGRLPRDTLVVCLNAELPPSLLCMDVAYYFRPFGVLLDNVANGWRYQPVEWQDVTSRGLIKAMQQQQQQQLCAPQQLPPGTHPAPWCPLVWEGPADPAPLLNADLLQPPKNIPCVPQAGGSSGPPGNAVWGTGPGGSHVSSGAGGVTCIKMPRRRRLRQQQQQQQGSPAAAGAAGSGAVLQYGRQGTGAPAAGGGGSGSFGSSDGGLAGMQACMRGLSIRSNDSSVWLKAPLPPNHSHVQQQQVQQGAYSSPLMLPQGMSGLGGSSSSIGAGVANSMLAQQQQGQLLLQQHLQQQRQLAAVVMFAPALPSASVLRQPPGLNLLCASTAQYLPQQQQQAAGGLPPLGQQVGPQWASATQQATAGQLLYGPSQKHVLLQQGLLPPQQQQQHMLLQQGMQQQQQVTLLQGSPHLQAQLDGTSCSGSSHTYYATPDHTSGLVLSDTPCGDASMLAALSTAMPTLRGFDVVLPPVLQPAAAAAVAEAPVSNDALLLQLLVQQQLQELQAQVPGFLGSLGQVSGQVEGQPGHVPTCMGLVGQGLLQQQVLVPLTQQQPEQHQHMLQQVQVQMQQGQQLQLWQ